MLVFLSMTLFQPCQISLRTLTQMHVVFSGSVVGKACCLSDQLCVGFWLMAPVTRPDKGDEEDT